MSESAGEIFLLYARNVGRHRWQRIIGPMWTSKEAVEASIAKNVSPAFEYKAVRYVLAEPLGFEVDAMANPLDPRVNA
jgi:hypothetical protein